MGLTDTASPSHCPNLAYFLTAAAAQKVTDRHLSHEIEVNYKWYKSTEPNYSFLLSVASCIFILTLSFFGGIAKRLPLSLLMWQPSSKCL
jgi:hypothetical protein